MDCMGSSPTQLEKPTHFLATPPLHSGSSCNHCKDGHEYQNTKNCPRHAIETAPQGKSGAKFNYTTRPGLMDVAVFIAQLENSGVGFCVVSQQQYNTIGRSLPLHVMRIILHCVLLSCTKVHLKLTQLLTLLPSSSKVGDDLAALCRP